MKRGWLNRRRTESTFVGASGRSFHLGCGARGF